MFASRILDVEESVPLRISALAEELKRQGKDIISLSAGEPDFDTPQSIRDAAKKAIDQGYTHYTPSKGFKDVRDAIATYLKERNGIPCSGENVLITPTKFAIFLSIFATIEKGDEVIIPDPAWVTYEACVLLSGGKPVRVATPPDKVIDIEGMKQVITPRTKMILLCSPSNPTGAVITRDEAKAIADIARDKNLLILSDEIYDHIIYDGAPLSIASLEGMLERTLTVGGFSKSWAMTGWRIGWLVASKEMIDATNKLQQHTLTCVPSFVQRAAIAALKEKKGVEMMVSEFRKRRDRAYEMLKEIPGFRCTLPRGAFYLFPSYDIKMDSTTFCERALREHGVALTPGSAFGRSCDHHIRISYATSMENLRAGCERIKAFVQKVRA